MTTMNAIPSPTSLTFINGSDLPDLGDHHLNKNQSATSKISTSVISLPIYSPTPSSQSQSLQPLPSPLPLPQLPLQPLPEPEDRPLTPLVAIRRTRRNVKPPGEW